jgi:hypothetical protein
MSKKLFSLSLLFGAFMFLATAASAQLNFFNGSACTVQVKAAAEQNATPCLGPTCSSGVVTVAPGGFATLPIGACLTTSAGLGYQAVKFAMTGGISAFADKCVGPNPAFFLDCSGTPRQLRIVSPNFAGIF